MYKEPKAMEEIHKIREGLYEEEKKMSAKQLIRKTREEVDKIKKKYHLKIRQHVV